MFKQNGHIDMILVRWKWNHIPEGSCYIGIYQQEYPLSTLTVRGATYEAFEQELMRIGKGRLFRLVKPDEQFTKHFIQTSAVSDEEFAELEKVVERYNVAIKK